VVGVTVCHYGSAGWGFESLRARHCSPRSSRWPRAGLSAVALIWPDFGRVSGFGRAAELDCGFSPNLAVFCQGYRASAEEREDKDTQP